MKKPYFALLLTFMLLLSACSGGGKEENIEDLDIEIAYPSYDSAVDWATAGYTHGGDSFEIPDGWSVADGEEHDLTNGVFIMPQYTEDFQFSAHVAVEVSESMLGEESVDLSDENTQKEFFAAQIAGDFSKRSGLSDLEFSVWESERGYIYIASFLRSNDTLTMRQTSYYVMWPDKTLYINASHFGEDTTPGVNEVARHIIASYE